jgi:bla regulator protein blaR1
MIAKLLSDILISLIPAVANHIWQSTVFAAGCGALSVFLRRVQARARYGVWLAASVKFLIPFSVLFRIGSRWAWTPASTRPSRVGLYTAIEQVSRPFTSAVMTVSTDSPIHASANPSLTQAGLLLLTAVWLCGFGALLFSWYLGWKRIRSSMKNADRLQNSREVEVLRQVEQIAGISNPTEIMLSRISLEPGIVGIWRPVLLWPDRISEHLEEAHLEAILAHEVIHVRRRDNLFAALHMLVQAVFWFHPLVWWLGARLVDERERACDEAVLELGSDRQTYAESILKTCQFCVGSPLPCISGITGSELKQRILRIMTQPVVRRLDLKKKLVLAAAMGVAIAAPIVFGLASVDPRPGVPQTADTPAEKFAYEVASIKPEKSDIMMFRIMNTPDGFDGSTTLRMLIRIAYGVEDNQIAGSPAWVNSEKYEIEAKMDQTTAEKLKKLSEAQMEPARQQMLQTLLADRFKLTIHRETEELPTYSLIVGKSGAKLHETQAGDTYLDGIKDQNGHSGNHMMRVGRGELTAQSIAMDQVAHLLTQQVGRTVIDHTGLKGNYDFTLHWTPDQSVPLNGPGGGPDNATASESGPSIFTAIQEQLGLKLESQKGPVEIIVIDHVEKPAEN